MVKKGVLTYKTGVKAHISGKAVGKIVSNQAINTSFDPEAHYLAAANLDYLFFLLQYEGSIVLVKITVKEYMNDQLDNNVYSIEVIDTMAKKTGMSVH
jgi:hypothetical protein